MGELVAFLEARLDEDEWSANRMIELAGDYGDSDKVFAYEWRAFLLNSGGTWDKVARDPKHFTPARVLREVTAKRAILAAYVTVTEASERNTAEHTQASAGWPDAQDRIYQLRTHGWQLSGRLEGLEVALRALAAVFSDHPDFQEQWR